MFLIAWKNLLNDKVRLLISIAGIAFAVLLMFIIKGIGLGISDSVTKYALNQENTIFVFQKGVENMQMANSQISKDLLLQIESIDGVKKVYGTYGFNYQYKEDESTISAYLIGFEEFGGPWKMKEGSKTPGLNEVVLDFAFAKKSNKSIGDTIEILGKSLKVVGISDETNALGGLLIFTDKATIESILNTPDFVNYALVTVNDAKEIDTLINTINQDYSTVHALKSTTVAKNEAKMIDVMFAPIINAMVLMVVVVSTVFVGLTIYNSTLEKLEEYTILKAIGTNRKQLFFIVFSQSFTIALIGSLIGYLFTYIVEYLFAILMPDVMILITIEVILKYILVVPVMALLATYIPLRKIYKIDEADVLRA